MRNIKLLSLVCLLVVFFDFQGAAKNLYVRKGASGSNNGSDWNNAWTDCSSIVWGGSGVNAGDTVWFAGGTYTTTLIPSVSGTSSAWVSIKRVRTTDSVPTSAAGWNSSYDSQVIFNTGVDGMDFNTVGLSYIIVDGRIDSGIQLVTPNNSGASVGFGNSVNYITLTNLELAGPGGTTPINMNGDNRGINAVAWADDGSGWVYQPINHLLVSHCRIHGQVNNLWLMNCYNTTIEYTSLYDSGAANSTTWHANVCATSGCTNITWRYNQIYNHQVEGIMCITGGAANWYIYGNVWHDGMTGVSRVLEVQDAVQGPFYFYNNTVVNVPMGNRTANGGTYAAGSQARNNIYWASAPGGLPDNDYDFADISLITILTEPHGIGLGLNPFANYSGHDYHIVSTSGLLLPRNKGVALGAPFNMDMDGNLRGADGAWDIGAYEYNAGGSDTTPPTVSLTAPAASAVVSNTITLSATASDNTGGSGVASVTFLVDGVAVGSSSSAPYTFAWNSQSVLNGAHTIQAKAQDVAGNQATSGSVAVTVLNPLPDTTPPTVSLTAPAAGAVVSNTITLSATASDNTGGSGVSNVTFLVDGVAVGSSSVAPYTISWNSTTVTVGAHSIQARAQDVAGNQTTSSSVTVTVLVTATGKSFYVRAGAAGSNNGSDWNNAWSDVTQINWGNVSPGASIWIAGGTYGGLLIGASGATNSPIYIARVRSTNSIPASAAGWNSTYDSKVVLSYYHNYGSYSWITLDGQVPYNGILITNTSLAGVYLMDYAGSSVSYSLTKNCDIGGPCTSSTTESGETRCFNCNQTGYGNYFGYCQFHNVPTLFSTLNQINFIVEHCKFYSNLTGSTATYHPNVWQALGCVNVTMRYCEVYNWQAEGIMLDFVSSGDPLNVNWYLYGNVWHDSIGGNTGGSARIVESQYNPNGPVYMFNNTFEGMVLGVNLANGGSWNSANASSNNIYFQTGGNHGFGQGHDDYDLSDASNSEAHGIGGATSTIFVNLAAQNYQIISNIAAAYPRNKGATLPAQYAFDFNGNLRGADGAWDIGAYEYNAGGSDTTPPTVSLTAPVASAVVSNTFTLSATASDNTGGSGVASVTFLVDGVAVGSSSSAPYTFAWNSQSVLNGAHTIQVSAQDVAGNQATSSSVTVTILNPLPDTTPPTVNLTAPTAGAVVSNTITLTATASDNTGGSGVLNVTFLVDGVAVGSSSVAPYSITWNSQTAQNGAHTIQVSAQDVAGNQATSSSVTVTVQNPGLTLLSGLVGYWAFDDASGKTATDSSGNGNNGTLLGDATWGIGHIRGALSLDGQTGYVQVPSTPNLEQFTNGVTICGWVYFGANIAYAAGTMQDVARKVVSLTTNLPPYSAYDLVVQDFGGGTFKARMGVTRTSDSTRGTSNWGSAHTYGSWYYLAGVYDGATVQIYVNGVSESSVAFSGTLLQTGQPLCIGSYGTVGEPVNGLVDDLRVYSRALSAAEIQILFNATAPSAPSSLIIQTN